jgi:hypothetical protein
MPLICVPAARSFEVVPPDMRLNCTAHWFVGARFQFAATDQLAEPPPPDQAQTPAGEIRFQ